MSYADGLLSSGERVIHREKQHWFVFIWGARYTILAIIAAILVAILTAGMTGTGTEATIRQFLQFGIIALFLAGLANLGWTVLRYLNQEYVITNRRVVQVQGVLNKSSTDSSLEKINDARLTQSIFGRMFGFGDLEILTAAETGIDEFRMLINPIAFKIAMLDAKHEYELEVSGADDHVGPPLRNPVPVSPSAAPPVPAAAVAAASSGPSDETMTSRVSSAPQPIAMSPDDVTRTLVSLADLRDRGAITPDEYERKKAELLSRL
jgi:Bacterial PH domain/Short C-terminal domain